MTRDGENAQEIRFAAEDLRNLRPSVRLAKEMGAGLGGRAPLLGQMPVGAGEGPLIRPVSKGRRMSNRIERNGLRAAAEAAARCVAARG